MKLDGLNEFAAAVYRNAAAHGWHDKPRLFPEIIALCHSELSEALEEWRNDRPDLYYPCSAGGLCCEDDPDNGATCETRAGSGEKRGLCSARSKKPEGVAIELADCMIRILDYCGKNEIDIESLLLIKHEYNLTRPYRHGGKRA